LPTESADFDGVDAEWKEMMAKIQENVQVISFTKDRSFLETLKACQNTLDKVQKGLNDYL
jgi:dynein heavy chain